MVFGSDKAFGNVCDVKYELCHGLKAGLEAVVVG